MTHFSNLPLNLPRLPTHSMCRGEACLALCAISTVRSPKSKPINPQSAQKA
ncbi:MAG: hypothetical protein OJF49_001505 [Ktedonobacterales bacterium]|nr:MAG: hypothetical protein OJF49_001505 [Ktedonobacterales bacterium]